VRQPSTMTLLIRGGKVVTAGGVLEADLLAQGERIKAIGTRLTAAHDTRVLDAEGCYVFPGVIDSHTHVQLDTGVYQTADDWFLGTRAAACGGLTTIVDFATQSPGQTLGEAVEARQVEASDAVIDYGLHVMITDLPPGDEEDVAVLEELGTPSAKLYTTYRPNYYVDDATLLRLMGACAEHGILPLVHCENDDLVTAQTASLVAAGKTGWRHHGASRSPLAEQEAIQRVLFLAEAADSAVHVCHCSTARSVALVAEAVDEGQRATCETCPQYLLLNRSLYEGPDPWKYILQPPLRHPEEPERLWTLVEAGMVDLMATDHCDYTKAQKLASEDFTETPGGLPGLETLLPLMFTQGVARGRLTPVGLSELLSANPARLWGLWPRKGALQPGSDADLVVYDPAPVGQIEAEDLHHAAGYSPYEGMEVRGVVKATVSRGEVIYREGRFTGKKGRGQFVSRRSLQEGEPEA